MAVAQTVDPDDLAGAVDSVVAGYRPRPGLVVGATAGSTTAVRGEGVSAAGGPRPDAGTLFQIGSVTKTFTALALAVAVESGDLELATPARRVVPGVPDSRSGAWITLGHLASHLSGLPRLPPGLRRTALRDRADPYRAFGRAELEAALARTRLRAEPGARYRYSNYGAGLLGEALCRAGDETFDEVIGRRVTGPLQLRDTVAVVRPDQQARRATGHSYRGRPVPDWDMGALAGAGALWSTTDDLLRYLRAHLRPEPTPLTEALHLVCRPRFTASRRLRIGLGWHASPLGPGRSWALWHNGGTGGFRSFVAFLPDADVSVVVLANSVRSVDGLGTALLRRVGEFAALAAR